MNKNTINVNEAETNTKAGLWCAGILSWLLVILGDLIRVWGLLAYRSGFIPDY